MCLLRCLDSCMHRGYCLQYFIRFKTIQFRAEYKENPVTDSQHPRLIWELNSNIRGQVQTAWQILAASSPELLATDRDDFWDSEKIKSNASNHVEYAGKPLHSGMGDTAPNRRFNYRYIWRK